MIRFSRFPYPNYRRIRHIIIVWGIETFALLLLDEWLPGLTLTSGEAAILGIAVIGLLNAILRPILLYFTITITVLSFGLLSFILNIIVVILAAKIVPGFIISNNTTALLVVLGTTLINFLITNLLSLDENDSYFRSVILRMQKLSGVQPSNTAKGLIIIQIDGLSEEVIRLALAQGYMPTIQSWIKENKIIIKEWDCSLPSQTSAIQATILYGNNEDIPAFRWYEKENQKLIVSNHINDTANLEKRFSTEDSLLLDEGSSIGNMFSGGAKKSTITMSQIYSVRSFSKRTGYLYNYFLNPYNFIRTFFLMIIEFFKELAQSIIKIFQKTPKIRRGLLFAIERTISAILLRDISTHLVIEDMFNGYKTIYCTYVGYDVVAHHAGIKDPASLGVLRGIDKQINRIAQTNILTNRDYQIILLSDHGQTEGHTFSQLYKKNLEQTIHDLLSQKVRVIDAGDSKEIKGYVNSIILEALKPYERMNQTAKKIYSQIKQKNNQFIFFDLPTNQIISNQKNDVIVCTSGNLAHIYFNHETNPLSLEDIGMVFPHFIEAIVHHPGIGFIMVRTKYLGPIVINDKGMHYLEKNRIEGEDPLKDYGNNAHQHLLLLSKYPHCGDLVINSKYNPVAKQAPAFEELLGHHGGLGGLQTNAFVASPKFLEYPDEDIIGAESLHKILRQWQTQLFDFSVD